MRLAGAYAVQPRGGYRGDSSHVIRLPDAQSAERNRNGEELEDAASPQRSDATIGRRDWA